MKHKLSSFSLMIVLILLLHPVTGCEKRPEALDRDTIRMIDTMTTKEIQRLRPELDSLCETRTEDYIRYYVDSLVSARLKDVNILKEK